MLGGAGNVAGLSGAATGVLATAMVKLGVDNSELTKGLSTANKDFDASTEKMMAQAGKVRNISAILFAAGVGMIAHISSMAAEDEKAYKRVASSAEAAGVAVESTLASFKEFSTEAEYIAGTSMPDMADAFSQFLGASGNAQDAMTMLNAALELQAGTGRRWRTVLEAVSMAYQGQTSSAEKWVKGLDDEMTGMEAVTRILEQYKGSMERTADSTEGAAHKMKVGWENAQKAVAQGIAPALNVLFGMLNKALEGFNRLSDGTKAWIGTLLLLGTSLAGVIAIVKQVQIIMLAHKLLLAQTAATTGAATVANRGLGASLLWLAKNPIAIAIAALAALVMAYDAAIQKAREFGASSDQGYGGNAPTIKTTDASGNVIYQTPGEISADTQVEGTPFLMGLFGGNRALTQSQKRIESYQRELQRYKERRASEQLVHQGTALPPWESLDEMKAKARSQFTQYESVNTQLAGATGIQ